MHTDSEGAVVATASPQVRGQSPGDAAEPTMPISIPRPGGATHTGLQKKAEPHRSPGTCPGSKLEVAEAEHANPGGRGTETPRGHWERSGSRRRALGAPLRKERAAVPAEAPPQRLPGPPPASRPQPHAVPDRGSPRSETMTFDSHWCKPGCFTFG